MAVIQKILQLRFIQLFRIIKQIGVVYFAILIVLAAVVAFFFFTQMDLFPNCFLAIAFLILVVLSLHIVRKDKGFIQVIYRHPWLIYFTEYTLLGFPFLVMMLFTQNRIYFSIPIVFFLLISTIKTRRIRRKSFIRFNGLLNPHNFEWIAGLRKHLLYIIVLYLLALGLSFYPYASLFFNWLMLGIIASFFNECEPFNVLITKELSPKSFILDKLKSNLKQYIMFTLPIIVVYSIFNWQTVYITLIYYALTLLVFSFFILNKYASYQPGYQLHANSVYTALALISIFIPFLAPLPIVLVVRNYHKSINTLKLYLDAYP